MERAALIGKLKALRYLMELGGTVASREAQLEAAEALNEAVQLLKTEAPRLLTEVDFQRDDADEGGGIPCWKETKSPTRRNGWAVIVYGKWLADEGTARYWTGKPTDEQREATPWL